MKALSTYEKNKAIHQLVSSYTTKEMRGTIMHSFAKVAYEVIEQLSIEGLASVASLQDLYDIETELIKVHKNKEINEKYDFNIDHKGRPVKLKQNPILSTISEHIVSGRMFLEEEDNERESKEDKGKDK